VGKRVAFVMSGCGNKDGTEIHEGVSALIALDRAGYDVICLAPDIEQGSSLDYISNQPLDNRRNALQESARIARGDIRPLSTLRDDEYDLVVFPGGFGAATTLCTFADDGADCEVNPEVRNLVEKAYSDGKPIAAMCIAPVLLARCLPGVTVTIGNDRGTASAIESMGAIHVDCSSAEAVRDTANRIVTTPAYMLASGPAEVFRGAERMVEELDWLLD
jgi:enhancing lycopene biosynthesis protein 2